MSGPPEHRELPVASESAGAPAAHPVPQWRAACRCAAGCRAWRVDFHPEATVIRVRVGVSQGDAVDVFLDERGVFVFARQEDPGGETHSVAIPVPGALDAERPWAQLREGELAITLPRPGRDQQRVPIAVRKPQQRPDGASKPHATDQPHA